MSGCPENGRQSSFASLHSRGIWRNLRGAAAILQRPGVRVLLLAVALVFLVLLFEFRSLSAPLAILASALLSTSGVVFALLITRTTFNISSFMGLIMVIGIVAKNGILLLDAEQKFRAWGLLLRSHDPGRKTKAAAHRDDRTGYRGGDVAPAFGLGAGSEMLQPLAIAVIGGILISMALSLVITPAVDFRLASANIFRSND